MTIGYKTVEVNNSGTDYRSGDSGTSSSVALNSLTDNTKNWTVDVWNNNFKLTDANGVVFTITDSSATVITVVGSPASGAYTITPISTGFIGGTTVIIDADKVDVDWSNSVLNIQKPVSKTTQTTALNAGDSYTYNSQTGVVTNVTGNFSSSLAIYDKMMIGGVEYTMYGKPVTNTVLIGAYPAPAASGTITACYKTEKSYGVNLKRITLIVSLTGWLTNDHVHHSDYTTKYYAEEKVTRLFTVSAASAGVGNFANIAIRENSFLTGKFMRFPASGVYGCMACTKMKFTDTTKDCAPIRGGGSTAQRADKIGITLTFQYQDPK